MYSFNLTGDTKKDAEHVSLLLASIDMGFKRNWTAASDQAAKLVLRQRGLQRYQPQMRGLPFPASSNPDKAARQRRYFFWALKHGRISFPYKRGKPPKSQRYGSQFYVESHPNSLTTVVGNRATYARYLADMRDQSRYMSWRGWRKLKEVVVEQQDEIALIYERWLNKTMKDLGLE